MTTLSSLSSSNVRILAEISEGLINFTLVYATDRADIDT